MSASPMSRWAFSSTKAIARRSVSLCASRPSRGPAPSPRTVLGSEASATAAKCRAALAATSSPTSPGPPSTWSRT
ncbi:hypothetical protein ACGFYS_21115 [Streptomyces omiyaensis]|uniref:Uncharacterized protein n=1 Tax=Streptomyces omiyaensis TaxID=68247 RepID=A0ABW7BV90_9ACTN